MKTTVKGEVVGIAELPFAKNLHKVETTLFGTQSFDEFAIKWRIVCFAIHTIGIIDGIRVDGDAGIESIARVDFASVAGVCAVFGFGAGFAIKTFLGKWREYGIDLSMYFGIGCCKGCEDV